MLILETLLWFLAAAWGLTAVMALLNRLLLTPLPKEGTAAHLLPLSVVLPARNEEAGIEEAVVAHCTQDYPDLEVVVVDDGSTDSTPAILGRLSARFPNLRVIACGDPPEGWLGKPNALRAGLAATRGALVLFADADVVYGPGVHRRAASEMARSDLDILVFLPHQEGPCTVRLVVSALDAIGLYGVPSFLYNVQRLKGFGLGAGAGNLVRRSALEAAGGLEALRGEVVEDIAMGRRLKALRGKLRVVPAFDCVRVQMYASLGQALEGFTKNAYAFLGFSPLRAALGLLAGFVISLLPAVVLAMAPLVPPAILLPAAIAAGMGLALECWACLWSGHGPWLAPLYPVRGLLWMGIVVRSAWRYHTKGLIWRGRGYGAVKGAGRRD